MVVAPRYAWGTTSGTIISANELQTALHAKGQRREVSSYARHNPTSETLPCHHREPYHWRNRPRTACAAGCWQVRADYLAKKVLGLRIFEDDTEKMNLSVQDKKGGVLVISQFTLYGDTRRGNRPSFDAAARPEEARLLYEYFVEKIRATGLRCETGEFQAMMEVELVNSGPVTILLDSDKTF